MDVDAVDLDLDGLLGLWDFGDAAGSGERFERFVERADSGGEVELVMIGWTQRARALGLERRFDEAIGVLDGIEEGGDLPEGVGAWVAIERGRVLNSSGDQAGSVEWFERALELARGVVDDGLAVDAAHMLGIVVDGEAGMEWNRRAMELAMGSGQARARKWRGSLLNNMGWSVHETGDFEEALGLFESALEVRIEEGKAENIRIGKWCVGRCLRSLGRVDEAMAVQRGLEDDPDADGYVFEEIGELLLLGDRVEEARGYFMKAHEMLSGDAWLVAEEPERIARLGRLGRA